MSDDEDDDDLFADFEKEDGETTLTVSENLKDTVSHQLEPIHKGDVDEGKITWESPMAPGLQNSVKVSEAKEKHWFRENADSAVLAGDPSPTAVHAFPVAAPGVAAPPNPPRHRTCSLYR